MATSRVIGLHGTAGSGKSEICKFLRDEAGPIVNVKFSGPLKAMLAAFYKSLGGIGPRSIDARIEGDLKETPDPLTGGITPRKMMQTLGGEWGRGSLRETFWIDIARDRIQWALTDHPDALIVVDDLRYPNELDLLAEFDTTLVKIKRPNNPKNAGSHPSEQPLPDNLFHFIAQNDGSVKDLHDAAGLLIKTLQDEGLERS